jgi:predicted PurR-regulated permease PerM
VLLGVIGGLFLFGVMGFLIGPLILALFLTFLEIYETEKNEANN